GRGRRTDHGGTVGTAPGADKGSTILSPRAREPTAVTAARTGWAVSATRTGWAASAGGTGRASGAGPDCGRGVGLPRRARGRAGNEPFTNPSGLRPSAQDCPDPSILIHLTFTFPLPAFHTCSLAWTTNDRDLSSRVHYMKGIFVKMKHLAPAAAILAVGALTLSACGGASATGEEASGGDSDLQ